eukprot:2972310-Pyramimonas_sp.AAC.1
MAEGQAHGGAKAKLPAQPAGGPASSAAEPPPPSDVRMAPKPSPLRPARPPAPPVPAGKGGMTAV